MADGHIAGCKYTDKDKKCTFVILFPRSCFCVELDPMMQKNSTKILGPLNTVTNYFSLHLPFSLLFSIEMDLPFDVLE